MSRRTRGGLAHSGPPPRGLGGPKMPDAPTASVPLKDGEFWAEYHRREAARAERRVTVRAMAGWQSVTTAKRWHRTAVDLQGLYTQTESEK